MFEVSSTKTKHWHEQRKVEPCHIRQTCSYAQGEFSTAFKGKKTGRMGGVMSVDSRGESTGDKALSMVITAAGSILYQCIILKLKSKIRQQAVCHSSELIFSSLFLLKALSKLITYPTLHDHTPPSTSSHFGRFVSGLRIRPIWH